MSTPTMWIFNQLQALQQTEFAPMFTNGNTTAHSRIDRIYVDQHTAEQLDRSLSATALAHTHLHIDQYP